MKKDNNFSVGSIVTLKSGGFPMTVTKVNDEKEEVTCTFFDPKTKGFTYAYLPTKAIKQFKAVEALVDMMNLQTN